MEKYLGAATAYQNCSHEQIKSRLKSGNVCCHSVLNNLSSSLLSKNIKIKIYRTIILPVLFWCGTWSFVLMEERRLRVLENRVLWKIFGPKRDEVTEDWRKLHNEELNDMSSSHNNVLVIISRRMRWAGHVTRLGDGRDAYRVLVWISE